MRNLLLLTGVVFVMTSLATAAVTCDIWVAGVAFGNYDSIGNQDRDTVGTISVTCSGNIGETASYTIRLSAGNGSYSSRTMNGGVSSIVYNLYKDIARTQVWGDGTSGTFLVTDSHVLDSTLPVTRHYTVYGRIPSGQHQSVAGSYSDNLLVTLEY